jgi:hypothetical protein
VAPDVEPRLLGVDLAAEGQRGDLAVAEAQPEAARLRSGVVEEPAAAGLERGDARLRVGGGVAAEPRQQEVLVEVDEPDREADDVGQRVGESETAREADDRPVLAERQRAAGHVHGRLVDRPLRVQRLGVAQLREPSEGRGDQTRSVTSWRSKKSHTSTTFPSGSSA